MPTDQELLYAYLAGFIDADGSITIVTAKSKKKIKSGTLDCIQYCIKLSGHNCKIEPIQLLQKTFGGGKLRNTRRGKVKLHPNWRACYEWSITKNQAANALRRLLPYLIIKKEQALLCLQMDDLKKAHNASERRWNKKLNQEINDKCEELKKKINLLNKRGQ